MSQRLFAATISAAAWLSAMIAPRPAGAHAEPYSYMDLRIEDGRLEGVITAHVTDLAHEIGLADTLPNPTLLISRIDALHAALERLLHLEADGAPVRPQWTSQEAVPDRKAIAFHWSVRTDHAPATIRVRGPLFAYDPAHETYVNVYVNGSIRHQDLLDHSHTETTFIAAAPRSRLEVARTFLLEGTHHIFIGPDHILFIVGLVLLGGSVGTLLRIITSFTVAHSITLAVATLGLVNPPARLVEPAIALSIIYVGADNLFARGRRRDYRALVAFGFGLVHGFGFASVLREVGLPRGALAVSLLSFNIGVEVGQACIVLTVAPLLAVLRSRRPEGARKAVALGSAGVLAAGAYWFVQRVFFA